MQDCPMCNAKVRESDVQVISIEVIGDITKKKVVYSCACGANLSGSTLERPAVYPGMPAGQGR